jgi:PAS domain S-box-containing protein
LPADPHGPESAGLRQHADEARAHLAAIVDSSEDAIISTTLAGVVASWNAGAERIFGHSAADIVGQPLALLAPAERQHEDPHILARIRAGERVAPFETIRRRKDGRLVYVSVAGSAIRDPAGTVVGAAQVARDITERKRVEESLIRSRQAAEAAWRELEAFSYSVAHDLRAPLRSIDGFNLALLEDYADRLDDTGRDYLRRARESAQYMARLIDSLLQLARVTQVDHQREPVDLSALARAACARLQAAQPGRAAEFRIADGLRAVGDNRLLGIALDHLLGNAWKFTARQERALIEFGRLEHAGPCVFFLRDNGAGFDMAYIEKLFGVFQRLHGADEFAGTGIGLATAQRIIRRHDGRIWAEGAVGEGACFYFTLNEPEMRT